MHKRLARGVSASFLSSAITQLMGMLASILCARILDPEGFGALNMTRTTVLMFGVLSGTGLGIVAVKFVAEHRDIDLKKVGKYIGFLVSVSSLAGVFATLICLTLSKSIAIHILGSISLERPLQIGSLILLLSSLSGVQIGVLSGLERFYLVGFLTALDATVSFVAIILGAKFWGLEGAIAGSALALLITFPIKSYFLVGVCKELAIAISYRLSIRGMRELIIFIFPAIAVGLCAQPFDWIARVILTNSNNGYLQLGLFSMAVTWSQIVIFIPGQIAAPTQAILSNLVGNGEWRKVSNVIKHSGLIIIGASLVVTIALWFFSSNITKLYGEQYSSASGTIVLLCFSSVFCAASMITKNYLYAKNKVWVVVNSHLLMGIILCGFGFALKDYGADGLAIAYLLGWASLFFFQAVFTKQELQKSLLI